MAKSIRWDLLANDRTSRGLASASAGYSRFGRQVNETNRSMARSGQDFDRVHTRFISRISSFGKVGVAAIGGVGVALGGLAAAGIKTGIQTAAGLENAQIAFKHLTGSAKAGQDTLAKLSRFAAITPFDLPGVETAAQQLLNAGTKAKDLIPQLTAIGNAASVTKDPTDAFQRSVLALSQAMGKGKLQGGDLLQIVEAGIPIWKLLSEATGKPIPKLQKMSEQGKLLTNTTLPLLYNQMQKDYGGAMEEQSRTLNGVWSTFKDNVSMSLAHVLTPLANMLKTILPPAGDAFAKALKGLSHWFGDKREGVASQANQMADLLHNKVGPDVHRLSLDVQDLAVSLKGLGDVLKDVHVWAILVRAMEEPLGLIHLLIVGLRYLAGFTELTARLMERSWLVLQIGWQLAVKGIINGVLAILNVWDAMAHASDMIFHTHLGRAADAAVANVRRMRDQAGTAISDLKKKVEANGREIQAAIDHMHGKRIDVTASLKLDFSKSFTQKDWVAVRLAAGRMAQGGLVTGPGGPTADRVPALLSSGEFVVNARAVSQIGPSRLKQLNAMRFARGGPVGAIDAESSAVNKVQAWGTGRRMKAGITKLMGSFGSFPSGAGSGVQRWAGVFLLALRMAGQSAAWLGLGLKRMAQESGGNPFAINLTDINARRGDPSRGLMQVIGATFRAYANGLLRRGIYDPLANIFAAIRYTLARYHTLLAWARPGGYQAGAWKVPRTGPAFLHQGEMVVPRGPAEAIRRGRGGAVVVEAGALQVGPFHVGGDMSPAAIAMMRSELDEAFSDFADLLAIKLGRVRR
jgi:tape measure domain-containing protein